MGRKPRARFSGNNSLGLVSFVSPNFLFQFSGFCKRPCLRSISILELTSLPSTNGDRPSDKNRIFEAMPLDATDAREARQRENSQGTCGNFEVFSLVFHPIRARHPPRTCSPGPRKSDLPSNGTLPHLQDAGTAQGPRRPGPKFSSWQPLVRRRGRAGGSRGGPSVSQRSGSGRGQGAARGAALS
jgi:hypothetical protein